MRILALIPARGGSKRVPNKNIKPLGGKTLINWTVEALKGIPDIVDTLVSTDDPEIAKVAKAAGVLLPWLRPKNLATDTAKSIDVCLHALDWYENEKGPVDGLLLLQPTSPFRTSNTISRGVNLFKESEGNPVVSFSIAESHPFWCYKLKKNRISPYVETNDTAVRSQDLPPAYVINGALYLASPFYLRTHYSFIGSETVPLIISNKREAIDIDTNDDWDMAEYFLSTQRIKSQK